MSLIRLIQSIDQTVRDTEILLNAAPNITAASTRAAQACLGRLDSDLPPHERSRLAGSRQRRLDVGRVHGSKKGDLISVGIDAEGR